MTQHLVKIKTDHRLTHHENDLRVSRKYITGITMGSNLHFQEEGSFPHVAVVSKDIYIKICDTNGFNILYNKDNEVSTPDLLKVGIVSGITIIIDNNKSDSFIDYYSTEYDMINHYKRINRGDNLNKLLD